MSSRPDHRPDHRPFPSLDAELDRLVASIQEAIRSAVAPVQDLGDAMIASQVGLIRPSLVLASCRAIRGEVTARARAMAEACELIHYASLLHEKGAALPVGTEGLWSPKKAILLGDLLLAGAMTRLADHGDAHDVAAVARITGKLAEGQIRDLSAEGEAASPELEPYLEVLRLRFGIFLHEAAGLGARGGGADHDDPLTVLLAQFGGAMAEVLRPLADVADGGLPTAMAAPLLAHSRARQPDLHTTLTALDNLGAAAPLADLVAWADACATWRDHLKEDR